MTVNPDVALPAGIYQHWKGPLYLTIGLAHDANEDDLFRHAAGHDPELGFYEKCTGREVVVYVGLQLDSAHEGARLAVRTLQDFFALVCVSKEHQHYGQSGDVVEPEVCRTVPRFSYRGPRFIDGMQLRRGFL